MLPGILAGVGLAWTLLVNGYLLFFDTYSGQSCTATSSSGDIVCRDVSFSFLAENGDGALIVLLIPSLFALGCLVLTLPSVRVSRFFLWFCAISLVAFVLLTGFSIGILYLPAAVACLIAAVVRPSFDEGAP